MQKKEKSNDSGTNRNKEIVLLPAVPQKKKNVSRSEKIKKPALYKKKRKEVSVGNPNWVSKYNDTVPQKMLDYFLRPETTIKQVQTMTKAGLVTQEIEVPAKLPTLEGFARSVGVSASTVLYWASKHPEMDAAYQMCRDATKEILNQNALMGRYSEGYAKFVAINYTDMVDKKNIESDMSVTINVVNYADYGA